MIKTILIDDDSLVIQALELMLGTNPDIHIVATGNNGQEAIELFQQHQPDLLLMDIRMQEKNGLEATEAILSTNPQARILFITTFQDDEYITKAMALGCRGYILKQHIKGIMPAIEAVMNEQLVFDSEIVSILRTPTTRKISSHLTEREQELIYLVAEGFNNKEIADKLFLSEGTVRNYLSQLLEKLNLRDRTQLAIYYYKEMR